MFFSGVPTCCDQVLARDHEILQEPRWKGDWVIERPVLTGMTTCPTCGASWLYSLDPRKVPKTTHEQLPLL